MCVCAVYLANSHSLHKGNEFPVPQSITLPYGKAFVKIFSSPKQRYYERCQYQSPSSTVAHNFEAQLLSVILFSDKREQKESQNKYTVELI